MNNLVLNINGESYVGWNAVHIQRSMDRMVGGFAVMGFDIFDGNPDSWDIKLGDEITVEIDKQEVCNGYIDSMPLQYTRDDGTFVTIRGRDKTADIVDCDFAEQSGEWKNQTVGNLLKNLCDPFSIEVDVDPIVLPEASIIVPEFRANIGEPLFELIAELCRDYSILPLSMGDGKLTLTRGTESKFAHDAIQGNGNAVEGLLNQSNENRFSNYIVLGQGRGNDNKQLTDFIQPYGSFADTVISRYRPTVIFSDTGADIGKCQNRAKWEARSRAGQNRRIIYTVLDWVQSNGNIWDLNTLVRVLDNSFAIDETMLISTIDYIQNDDGIITQIEVVLADTYSLLTSAITNKTGFDR